MEGYSIRLSPELEDLNGKIQGLFAEADERIGRFWSENGISCPAGCGTCCAKKGIEATVLEFIPLAVELWKRNEAETCLNVITGTVMPEICIFFKPEEGVPGNGRCGVYKFRGLVCRLFGFIGIRDRTGTSGIAACAVIRKDFPDGIEKARGSVLRDTEAPFIRDFSTKLMMLFPDLGIKTMPINLAVKNALEKVALNMDLERSVKEVEL
jgi:Fe-S-cluster containining protein